MEMFKNSKILHLFFILFLCLGCNQGKNEYIPITSIAMHSNGMEYIGMDTCVECHADIVSSHKETAHWLTSALATEATIRGSLDKKKNSFQLNENITFNVVKKENKIYQEGWHKDSTSSIYSSPIDIVFGSGTKGQSYLHWKQNSLFQLQASYFTPTDSWINSPGYSTNSIKDKIINPRCLECHLTYAEFSGDAYFGYKFNKDKLVYGIDCQRCHGTVSDHVEYHRKYPKDSTGKYIMKYSAMSRRQQLDACALCHSGEREQTLVKGYFKFLPGDSLNNFSLPNYKKEDLKKLDVHGNQYGHLQASECFKKSNVLNCTTCHDPHKKDRGNKVLFNNKCITCHNNQLHAAIKENGTSEIYTDCIACHMPLIDSKIMKVQVSIDSVIAVKVRSHLIGIYND